MIWWEKLTLKCQIQKLSIPLWLNIKQRERRNSSLEVWSLLKLCYLRWSWDVARFFFFFNNFLLFIFLFFLCVEEESQFFMLQVFHHNHCLVFWKSLLDVFTLSFILKWNDKTNVVVLHWYLFSFGNNFCSTKHFFPLLNLKLEWGTKLRESRYIDMVPLGRDEVVILHHSWT